MQYYWPGPTKKDLNLWKDQWFAHGSDSPLVPLDYFQMTIQLRKLVDLVKALRDVGIVPRYKGFTHHESTYRQGIMKITGHNNTILKCYSSKRGHLLSEVMLCVDADARNFIDCNPEEFQQQNCGPDILFSKGKTMAVNYRKKKCGHNNHLRPKKKIKSTTCLSPDVRLRKDIPVIRYICLFFKRI
ncbi:hypothetical protein WN944_005780 [Citrus x changshan-huyou]|uniref:Large ribosomal subunit protein eL40 domain-containing protein n=1 Tax=Citrus x changshan-huyou TaxID=2935761 RepID=A0AAP0QSW5_9ROSI